jgi:hypothetical protein
MHKLCLSFALVFGTLSSALAQLSVEVRLEQDQFLAGEQIVAAVRITNRSGQTIRLGADEDWLAISVEGLDGKLLPRFSDPPVAGEFELETSKIATKRVNLSPYFPLTEAGRYNITATVKVKEWGIERGPAGRRRSTSSTVQVCGSRNLESQRSEVTPMPHQKSDAIPWLKLLFERTTAALFPPGGCYGQAEFSESTRSVFFPRSAGRTSK